MKKSSDIEWQFTPAHDEAGDGAEVRTTRQQDGCEVMSTCIRQAQAGEKLAPKAVQKVQLLFSSVAAKSNTQNTVRFHQARTTRAPRRSRPAVSLSYIMLLLCFRCSCPLASTTLHPPLCSTLFISCLPFGIRFPTITHDILHIAIEVSSSSGGGNTQRVELAGAGLRTTHLRSQAPA